MTPTPATAQSAAYVLGAVLLAQCAVLPIVLGRGDLAAFPSVCATAAAGAMLWSIPRVGARDVRGLTGALALAPSLLALTSVTARTLPRFDPIARIVAALTAIGYFVAVLALHQASAPRVALGQRVSARAVTAPPPLRWVAWLALGLGGAFLALIAPARLAARALTGPERALGPGFASARDTMVSSVGLLFALLWTLSAGPKLVRGKGSPYGRRARAVAMVVWSFAFGALWWWVEHAR